MNYIILEKDGNKYYWPIKKNKISNLYNLWSFLNGLSLSSSFFKEWILEPSRQALNTNNCRLRKENDYVIINELYGEDPENEDYDVRISPQELCKLIDDWDTLCEAGAENIIIWSVGDDFAISEYREPEQSSINNNPRKDSHSSIS